MKKDKNMHFCPKGSAFSKISQMKVLLLSSANFRMYNHFHVITFEERIISERKGCF